MPLNVLIFRLSSSVIWTRPLLINISSCSKNTRLCGWMCGWMSLSNVFRTANIWQKIDNSKSSNRKFRQKVDFFRWRDETWTSWCRGFVCTSTWTRLCLSMLRSFVYVVFQVVFLWIFALQFDFFFEFDCEFDLQLVLQFVFLLNTRPCIDFSPYLWHSSSIRPTLRKGPIYVFFLLLFFLSLEVKAEGGAYGGVLHKGFKGREKRGGERVGSRRRSSCTSSRGFRPNFDTCVNEIQTFQKKVFRFFGFLSFFPYICLVNEWNEWLFESKILIFNF